MSEVLISLIMPTYNSEKTIFDAVESVVLQDFQNVELLIIDGDSKDSTLSIINEIRGRSTLAITVVSEKDQGIYDAINKGVKMAKGEWIYVLGSDDRLFAPDVLSNVATALKNTDAEFVYGDVSMAGKKYLGEFDKAKLLSRNICQQAIFYKKVIFDFLGLFELRYKIYADYIFNIHCFFDERIKAQYIPITVADYSLEGLSGDKVDEMYVLDYADLLQTVVKGKIDNEVLYEQYAKCGLQLIYKSHIAKGLFWVTKAFLLTGKFNYLGMLLPKKIRKPLGIQTFWN